VHLKKKAKEIWRSYRSAMEQLLEMMKKVSLGQEKDPSTEIKEGKKRRIKTKTNSNNHKRRVMKTDGSTGSQAHVTAAHAPNVYEEALPVVLKHKKSSSTSNGMKEAEPTRKVTRARRTGIRSNSRRVAPLPFQPLPLGASKLAVELYDDMQRMILPFRTVTPQLQSFHMAVQGRYDMLMKKGQLSPKQVNVLKVHRETYSLLKHIYEDTGVDLHTLLKRIESYLQFMEAERLRVEGETRLRLSQEYSRIFVHFPEIKYIVENHKTYVMAKTVYEPDTVRPGELEKADDLVELFGNFRM
jgi:hypothetical protein